MSIEAQHDSTIKKIRTLYIANNIPDYDPLHFALNDLEYHTAVHSAPLALTLKELEAFKLYYQEQKALFIVQSLDLSRIDTVLAEITLLIEAHHARINFLRVTS